MIAALAITFAYVVGSIPFAFLLSRQRGVDLRRAGSGNVGASNVLRTTGVGAALLAMLLDGLKGAGAVLMALSLGAGPPTAVASACASIVGHIYPFWLRFHGGKGVATAAGAFAVLTPTAFAIASGVFVVAVIATRYVSVGSIAAAVTLAAVAGVSDVPGVVAIGATLSALMIVYRHRGNLARLAAGTERRIGQRAESASNLKAPTSH